MEFTNINNLMQYLSTLPDDSTEFMRLKVTYDEIQQQNIIDNLKNRKHKKINLHILCFFESLKTELLLKALLENTQTLETYNKTRTICMIYCFEECMNLHNLAKIIELPIAFHVGEEFSHLTMTGNSGCDFIRYKDLIENPPNLETLYIEFSNDLASNLDNVFSLFEAYYKQAYFLTEQERLKLKSMLTNDGYDCNLVKFEEYNQKMSSSELLNLLEKKINSKKDNIEEYINEKENIKKYFVSTMVSNMEYTYGTERRLEYIKNFWDSLNLHS